MANSQNKQIAPAIQQTLDHGSQSFHAPSQSLTATNLAQYISELRKYESNARDYSLQEQLSRCMGDLEKTKEQLQGEKVKYANDISYLQKCLGEQHANVCHRDQRIQSLTSELHRTQAVLKDWEHRSQERWASIMDLAALLRCQLGTDGGQVDVAKLAQEKETFRDECNRLTNSQSEYYEMYKRSENVLIEAQQELKEIKANPQHCNDNCHIFEGTETHWQTLGPQQRQLDPLIQQPKAGNERQTRSRGWAQVQKPTPLIGPVPQKQKKQQWGCK